MQAQKLFPKKLIFNHFYIYDKFKQALKAYRISIQITFFHNLRNYFFRITYKHFQIIKLKDMDYKPKKDEGIRITELFMAKAGMDWSRCFYGTIIRNKDEKGKEIGVYGKILIKTETHNGFIYSSGIDQWEMGDKLDELVLLVLDYGLHDVKGKISKIAETDFFHN